MTATWHTVSCKAVTNCYPNNLLLYKCSLNCYLVQNSLLVVAFCFFLILSTVKLQETSQRNYRKRNVFFRFSAGDWSRLPCRSFKRSLAMWDAVGLWSSSGTGNYHYTSLLVPGWTRQISCRNWSYELMQIPNMCDKEVSQWSRKRHPVSELWQDERKRGSCPRFLFVGCIKWNVGKWNCFTDKKKKNQLAHRK